MSASEFVEATAPKLADIERRLNEIHQDLLAISDLADEARKVGLMGFLQSQRCKNDIRSAAGDVATAASKVFAVHREGTLIAQEMGVDLPQPEDGGGGR